MQTLVVFLAVIGAIVFVHEFGHFVLAKLCGVYVDCFSLGFGPRLLWLKTGETEYRISLVPLGGYVRMAGQEDMPEDEAKSAQRYAHVPPCRHYDRKAVWQRMAIIAAGPLMNLVFALPVAFALLAWGERMPLPADATTIGSVLPGSPAQHAGIMPGDKLVAIGGHTVGDWFQIQRATIGSIGSTTTIRFVRNEREMMAAVLPVLDLEKRIVGIGIEPMQRAQVASVISNMPAAHAGLRPGDIVERLIGIAPTDLSLKDVMTEIQKRPTSRLLLGIVRLPSSCKPGETTPGERRNVPVTTTRVGGFEHIDLVGCFIVCEGTAPSNFVVQTGDRILCINGRALGPDEVQDYVQSLPSGEVPVEIERVSGRFVKRRVFTNAVLRVKDTGLIGVAFDVASQRVIYTPKEALKAAPHRCVVELASTAQSLRLLFVKRIGWDTVSGPVGIARITGHAARRGMDDLLRVVLLLTISLGVLNLLPLPVLDGGHLVFLTIEGIRRRPLSLRVMLWIQKISISLLLALFAVVTYRDAVQWLRDMEGFGLFLGRACDWLAPYLDKACNWLNLNL